MPQIPLDLSAIDTSAVDQGLTVTVDAEGFLFTLAPRLCRPAVYAGCNREQENCQIDLVSTSEREEGMYSPVVIK